MCISEVRKSLRNVQELVTKGYVDGETLHHLLELLPNVTTFKGRIGAHGYPNAVPWLLRARHVFTTLHIRSTYLSDGGLAKLLESCSGSLRELRIHRCCDNFSDESCSAIGQCTKLRNLYLDDVCDNFGDSQLETIIRNAPELESLLVGYSELTGANLLLLTDLKRLQRLTLRGGRNFHNDAIGVLGRIATLRSLSVENMRIAIDIGQMKHLASLTNLRELTLSGKRIVVTPECFNIICESFFGLELLRLEGCQLLTDEEGIKFCLFTRLKKLRLHDVGGLTDVAFEKGLGPPSLEHLELSFCELTDIALTALAVHHHRLRKLTLSSCPRITDAGVATLLRRQTQLRRLFLFTCDSLKGQFLIELAGMCPRLQKLHVWSSCARRNLELFRRRRPSVRLRKYIW